MTSDERKQIVRKTSERVLHDLEKLKGYSRLYHVMKLVDMLDDTRLVALDFATDLTPEISEGGA